MLSTPKGNKKNKIFAFFYYYFNKINLRKKNKL